MRVIQTLNDIEYLKVKKAAPKELLKVIEHDFLLLFGAEETDVELTSFRLPYPQVLILLETGDDVIELFNGEFDLEYVERYECGKSKFYRLAKRIDRLR